MCNELPQPNAVHIATKFSTSTTISSMHQKQIHELRSASIPRAIRVHDDDQANEEADGHFSNQYNYSTCTKKEPSRRALQEKG